MNKQENVEEMLAEATRQLGQHVGDILTLSAVVSKVAEDLVDIGNGLIMAGKGMEATQLDAVVHMAIPVLQRWDREHPGLMPLPKDGVRWSER